LDGFSDVGLDFRRDGLAYLCEKRFEIV